MAPYDNVNYHWNCETENLFQLTFTCSKSTTETLGKGEKYVESLQ